MKDHTELKMRYCIEGSFWIAGRELQGIKDGRVTCSLVSLSSHSPSLTVFVRGGIY